jgi:hypothetical protein
MNSKEGSIVINQGSTCFCHIVMKVVNQVKGINGGNLVEIKTFHKAQLGWTQLGSEQ